MQRPLNPSSNPVQASEFQNAFHVVDGIHQIHNIMCVLMVMVIKHADEVLLICNYAIEPTENSDCPVIMMGKDTD